MIAKDELFSTRNHFKKWQKYCGFFDLSLTEFMEIQEQLLLEHIDLIYDSPLAKKLMSRKPKDMSEFRKLIPLTTYDDYASFFDNRNEDVLAAKPYCWGHTSGRGGTFKWVPYTERAIETLGMLATALMVLACTKKKGEINLERGFRILTNLPPAPYLPGILNQVLTPLIGSRVIPPLGKYDNADFETRMSVGFEIAMRTGVDILSSLTSVLVKMGESFSESSRQLTFNKHMLHPQVIWRLMRALISSKSKGRDILPKDLWPLKGLIAYGTDTTIYRNALLHYWGKEPLETYASTETGIMATSAWNKKTMTFVPFSCFFEFAPEDEWLKSRENKDYQPSTILLDEVQPGRTYEVIVSSFYGMPFLRYRLGDLIKIIAMEDKEAGIELPQMDFKSRSDGIIDIAGFSRLDEKTIWQAIVNTGLKYEDWSARKEYEQSNSIVRLYIEPKETMDSSEIERLVHNELRTISNHYKDLEGMLGIQPLKVVVLPAGAFKRYYHKRKEAGADLAHLKPPHTNASDSIINELLNCTKS
jgi:hypothetical protein